MRRLTPALAVLALTALGSPAAASDCAGITDSLLRLRCYDDAARTEKAAPSRSIAPKKAGVAPKADFAAYQATPYLGRPTMPDFTSRDRKHAMFRTRVRDGIRGGANFAGHLALIQFGCGTGCSVVLLGDVRTGQVYDFPLGGEDTQALGLEYRAGSRLVVARWEDVEKDRCITAQLVWTGSGFERISRTDLGTREVCWEANRL